MLLILGLGLKTDFEVLGLDLGLATFGNSPATPGLGLGLANSVLVLILRDSDEDQDRPTR